MTRHRLVALACALAALATTGVAVAASIADRGWRISALVHLSDREPIAAVAREHDPSFAFVPITSHYDGVYFYAIALDPLGRGAPAAAIKSDRGVYRYGHAGYGWMAWALSLGRPEAAPTALAVLALIGVAVGAAAASALARDLGVTPWAGLAVAFNPGIVYAATVLTSETVGVALLMLALLAWTRERRVWAAVALTAACLTKEPFLLVPVALGVWELVRGLRERGLAWLTDAALWRRAGLLLAGPAVFGLWYVSLTARFDVVPNSLVGDLTRWPFLGWIDSFRIAARLSVSAHPDPQAAFAQGQLGAASVPLLATAAVLLGAGLVAGLRLRTHISLVVVGLALVAFSLTWLGVLYPKDLIREVSMPLTLLPLAFAGRLPPGSPAAEEPAPPSPEG